MTIPSGIFSVDSLALPAGHNNNVTLNVIVFCQCNIHASLFDIYLSFSVSPLVSTPTPDRLSLPPPSLPSSLYHPSYSPCSRNLSPSSFHPRLLTPFVHLLDSNENGNVKKWYSHRAVTIFSNHL